MITEEITYNIGRTNCGNYKVLKREYFRGKTIYTLRKYYGFKTVESAQKYIDKQIQLE